MADFQKILPALANLTILKDVTDYSLWDFDIKIVLKAHDLLKFVNGDMPLEVVAEESIETWHHLDA